MWQEVIESDYRKNRIRIACNPREQRFAVSNITIEKDSAEKIKEYYYKFKEK